MVLGHCPFVAPPLQGALQEATTLLLFTVTRKLPYSSCTSVGDHDDDTDVLLQIILQKSSVLDLRGP
ncbi:hypothetical protein INR49_007195 [Caranx melampygus]|nr:hypothetical protein INR49_007195 [Caranx melampygus]